MLQFHEVGSFWVVLRVANLLDTHLHLEPSILFEYCNVKPFDQADFDSELQLVPNFRPVQRSISLYIISDRSGLVCQRVGDPPAELQEFAGELIRGHDG